MKTDYDPIASSDFPDTGWLEIDPSKYSGAKLVLAGTEFILLGRKHDGIGLNSLIDALCLTWPKWIEKFPVKIPSVTIVDGNLPMGSGVLRSFAVGVYLGTADFNEAQIAYMKTILGWEPHPNSVAYIERYYSEFSDPQQAYVIDHLNHALGHIYFLCGVSRLSQSADSIAPDTWFALGIGMVYDNLIWHEIFSKQCPRLEAFVNTYKKCFANRVDIDQRLINAETSGDEAAGVSPMLRLQIYGHAKSFVFLNEMRLRVRPKIFDHYVAQFLSRSIGSAASYEVFLGYFSQSDLQIAHNLETEFVVR